MFAAGDLSRLGVAGREGRELAQTPSATIQARSNAVFSSRCAQLCHGESRDCRALSYAKSDCEAEVTPRSPVSDVRLDGRIGRLGISRRHGQRSMSAMRRQLRQRRLNWVSMSRAPAIQSRLGELGRGDHRGGLGGMRTLPCRPSRTRITVEKTSTGPAQAALASGDSQRQLMWQTTAVSTARGCWSAQALTARARVKIHARVAIRQKTTCTSTTSPSP